jgi:hypothetical protein
VCLPGARGDPAGLVHRGTRPAPGRARNGGGEDGEIGIQEAAGACYRYSLVSRDHTGIRVHQFGDRQVIWLQVNGDRAYLDLTASTDVYTGPDLFATDREVGVVDLEAGRVLTQWRGRLPWAAGRWLL